MRATVWIALCTLLVACGDEAFEEKNDGVPHVSTARLAPRIVGGAPSSSAQDATVYLSIGEDGACTGTLVAANLVLTARHCVSEVGDGGSPDCGMFTSDFATSMFSVRLGVAAADDVIAARAVKVYRPAGNDGCDDIALVQLDRTLAIRPAAVRFTPGTVGETTTVVGYGEDGFGGVPDERFQRGGLPLTAVGPASFDYVTQNGQRLFVDVPAKTIATGESTCFGDSGGPLFDATGAVIGVTSRGIDDDCIDRPSLYTATAAFETFIREAAKSAGHPLSSPVTTQSAPVPDETDDGEADPSVQKKRPRTSSDESDEDLDEPTAAYRSAASSGCNASRTTPHERGSCAGLVIAMAAVLAMASRRNRI